MLDTFLNW